jgi:hypothetical protein
MAAAVNIRPKRLRSITDCSFLDVMPSTSCFLSKKLHGPSANGAKYDSQATKERRPWLSNKLQEP